MGTMLSDICRRSTTSDRHAVDAFLPNIEPDAGKNLDAFAKAKPHTQFSTTSEKAASSEVGGATDAVKNCFLSFIGFPHCKSTGCESALGELTQRRQGNRHKERKVRKEEKNQLITTELTDMWSRLKYSLVEGN